MEFGARTKYEWLALVEDIDRGVKMGIVKHRPKNRRFRSALAPLAARPAAVHVIRHRSTVSSPRGASPAI